MFEYEEYMEIDGFHRAYQALMKDLSANQQRMVRAHGCFGVVGGDSGNCYLIGYYEGSVRVARLSYDSEKKRWARVMPLCSYVEPDEKNKSLPYYDRMLVFKHLIESRRGESYFIGKSNPLRLELEWLWDDFVI